MINDSQQATVPVPTRSEDRWLTPGVAGVGASSFFSDSGHQVTTAVLPSFLTLEDGLAESDWDGWTRLNERLGEHAQLVGDDILVTNPAIVARSLRRVRQTRRYR